MGRALSLSQRYNSEKKRKKLKKWYSRCVDVSYRTCARSWVSFIFYASLSTSEEKAVVGIDASVLLLLCSASILKHQRLWWVRGVCIKKKEPRIFRICRAVDCVSVLRIRAASLGGVSIQLPSFNMFQCITQPKSGLIYYSSELKNVFPGKSKSKSLPSRGHNLSTSFLHISWPTDRM